MALGFDTSKLKCMKKPALALLYLRLTEWDDDTHFPYREMSIKLWLLTPALKIMACPDFDYIREVIENTREPCAHLSCNHRVGRYRLFCPEAKVGAPEDDDEEETFSHVKHVAPGRIATLLFGMKIPAKHTGNR